MIPDQEACPLCSGPCQGFHSRVDQEVRSVIRCPACGDFLVTDSAVDLLDTYDKKSLLAGFMREATDMAGRKAPFVTDDVWFAGRTLTAKNLDAVAIQCPTTVSAKIDKLLQAIARRSEHPGAEVSLKVEHWAPLAYAARGEIEYYLRHAGDSQWIEFPSHHAKGKVDAVLRPEGWRRVDDLSRVGLQSDQAFVAMWFDESVRPAYERGIAPAISAAGYRPLRLDSEEFNEGIPDRIIAEIRTSRFVVADLTGARQNTYLEAGYCLGLGLELILTCRKDHLDGTDPSKRVHFDLQHRNLIAWDDETNLKDRLASRILATVGPGPLVTSVK